MKYLVKLGYDVDIKIYIIDIKIFYACIYIYI